MSTPADIEVKHPLGVGAVYSVLRWLLLGVVLLAVVIVVGDVTVSGVIKALNSVSAWIYAPIALMQAVVIILAAQKWCLILRATAEHEKALRLTDAVAATTLGALAGQVLPIQLSTPAARAWIARRHNMSALRAVGTSAFEQVFEVLVLISMGVVAIAANILGATTGMMVVMAVLIVLVLTALIRPVLHVASRVTQMVAKCFARTTPALISALADGFSKTAALRYGLLLQLTGLSFVRYVLMAALNVGVLLLLAPDVSAVTLLIAYPTVLFLMSLPFFPGGLGVVELTWVGILISQGIDTGPAAETAITLRIVTTFGFVLIAPVLLAFVTPRCKDT